MRPRRSVGRNCRFLQGRNTDRAAVGRISDALAQSRPVTEVLLNYRRDGTAFWNQIVDLAGLRRLRRRRQLRGRAERRHRADDRRAGAPSRARRGRGGPRAAAPARRRHHPDDRRAGRRRRVRAAGPQPRAGARRPVRRRRARACRGAGCRSGSPSPRAMWTTRSGCASSAGCATTTWVGVATPATFWPATGRCSCRNCPSAATTAIRTTRQRPRCTTCCACGR